VAGPTSSQILPGNSAQLGVNEGNQAVERLFIALAPGGNQSADVRWTFDHHSGAELTTRNSALVNLLPAFPEYKAGGTLLDF
jgi:hypothetical protein